MDELLLRSLDEASIEGDINKFKQLYDHPLLLDKVLTEVRDNPLHIAALLGHVPFTADVVKLKPELARKLNKEGQSPLHLAAARGHLQVAKILVNEAGLDICRIRESNHGCMPVHIATLHGNHDIVRMLSERCTDTLEKTTNKGETLLHLAVKAQCIDCVGYFVDNGVKLNEKDENGYTCLHLAAAKHNPLVIRHLLDQQGIDINSTNSTGLTPLDVLLVPSCSDVDNSLLVDAIRSAGGKRATELSDIESNRRVGGPPQSNLQRLSSGNRNSTSENLSASAQTLLIVATLVATMTFQAISNPPGGFIQPPFQMTDVKNSTWINNWKDDNLFPAGRPVLLWQLDAFFILDSIALFASVSVILWLLLAEPKNEILMLLVAVVWFSTFCAALAFCCAFVRIFIPSYYKGINLQKDFYMRFHWVHHLIVVLFVFYIAAGFFATVRVIGFLRSIAGFETQLPNWIAMPSWLNRIGPYKTSILVVLMVCVVAAFLCVTFRIVALLKYAALNYSHED